LDSITNEADLLEFEQRLIDRFGKIPEQGQSLMLVVRLRWLAMQFGMEKLTLKNEKLIAFLVSNPKSNYYQSDNFGKILHFMTVNPRQCQLREQNGRRSVVFNGIRSIEQAMQLFMRF
jgi:transcription-repair coupling factor (superfamily II helicase)